MLHDQFRAERIFSRWRIRPCFGEPTNAYFARLVYDGENCLPETFAKKTGVWVSRNRWQILLQSLLNLPLTDEEKHGLVKWSPVYSENRRWALGDENISMTMAKPGARSCSECLKEAAYHRVWWDLNGFQICPVHDCALQPNPNRHDRRWPFYGLCSVKVDVPPELSARGRESIEGYILQRLGAVKYFKRRPMLDNQPLDAIMSSCSLVGTLLANPPARRRPKMSNINYNIGFDALGGNEKHLIARFRDWLNEHHPKEKLRQNGVRQFGFLNNLSHKRNPLKDTIWRGQVKACLRLGRLNPRLRTGPGIEAQILKSNLPNALGISIYSANSLLRRSGFNLRRGSGQLVSIPKGLLEELRIDVAESVPLSMAATLLGCTENDADMVAVKLAKSGWTGCIQVRHEQGVTRHFIKRELEELLETIRSLPKDLDRKDTVGLSGHTVKDQVSETRLMADVLLGRQAALVDPDIPGLRGLRFRRRQRGFWNSRRQIPSNDKGMPASEFFSMTGIPKGGARYLISLGVLKPHPNIGISRPSAKAFHERFINPVRYFLSQGVVRFSAAKQVEACRLKYAFPPEDIGCVMVERKHLIEKIGPLYQPPQRILDLWPAVVESGSRNCRLLMISEVPGAGMFDIGPSSRLLSVKANMEDDGIEIHMEFLPGYQRMWRIVLDNEPEIMKSLGFLTFHRGDRLVTITGKVRTVEDIELATIDLGRLNEFFRNRNR
ncbi:TniQ family protein [Neorhizobium sp. T6_25]|uniref:TniQ family protein n=1 Tax=Neorhizobium sp. T6_25 TaxID=2093833 RepID=UPI00155E118A|nr:TniQ family protein [Neorhizobium sp. T6_25]